MDYNCSRCGRLFACAETISFCPFCGQAYMGVAQSVQAITQRIVIGSDSERTIQEKYWKSAQAAISSVLLRLRRSLPHFTPEEEKAEIKVPKQYELPDLNLRDFRLLRKSTSISLFKVQLEEYLKKLELSCSVHTALLQLAEKDIQKTRQAIVKRRLSFELGEWSIEDLEDERSIDVNQEAVFINGFCSDLAETVGSMNPGRLVPKLDYDPDTVDWVELMKAEEEWETLSSITTEHEQLLKTIKESVSAVMSAISQNSLFVLSAMQFDVEEDVAPSELANRLKALDGQDYDPIFGEPPEHLIEVFSDAVVYMTKYLNGLPDYEDVLESTGDQQITKLKERLDRVKLDALYDLIEKWSGVLTQELDRLYQSQSENMLDVYNAIVAIQLE